MKHRPATGETMAKQLDMFAAPKADADDRLNAAVAEMRRTDMRRSEQRKAAQRSRHHESRVVLCPSCGSCVTIRVS